MSQQRLVEVRQNHVVPRWTAKVNKTFHMEIRLGLRLKKTSIDLQANPQLSSNKGHAKQYASCARSGMQCLAILQS